VLLEDVCGDVDDLIGSKVVRAEEPSSNDAPPPDREDLDSYSWTFYIIGTSCGTVTFRWLETTNGCDSYSKAIDFVEIE